MSRSAIYLSLGIVLLLASCSDGGGAGGTGGVGAAGGIAGSAGAGAGGSAYTGDCAADDWAPNVSQACWSCLCAESEANINGCDDACVVVLECVLGLPPASQSEAHCLAGDFSNIGCEAACVGEERANSPEDAALFEVPGGVLSGLDLDLIGSSNKPSGAFRACETECELEYDDDALCGAYPPSEE